jgi:hypothetical protein
MCHHRRITPVLVFLFVLLACALPAAAQPAAEHTAPGLRWIELWQSFLAPFAVLTGEGRAIWDPNGGDAADAPPPAIDSTVDDMAGGGRVSL